MKTPDAPKSHIVAAALLGALTEARWRSGELLSRKSAELAPDLLRGHAAEMAFSPIGRDQVLSLALSAAADDLEAGRAPADERALFLRAHPPDESARAQVRGRIPVFNPAATREVRAVVEELERRCRPECRGDVEMSERLANEADLQELLWDDPRLPCEDRVRLIMLLSVAQLRERAQALGRPALAATDGAHKPDEAAATPRRGWTEALRAALGRR